MNKFHSTLRNNGREQVVDIICSFSQFEKDELSRMSDSELEGVWFDLEIEDWLEETV